MLKEFKDNSGLSNLDKSSVRAKQAKSFRLN